MLLIPDVVICNTLNALLKGFRDDYKARVAANQENRSMLYLLFNGVQLGRYNYYDNLKTILITTEEDPRHVEVKLSYDSGQAKYPQIYISLPSEADKNNSLGIGSGNQEELTFTNDEGLDEYRMQFSRRWSATYNVVALSDNQNEVVILYHLLKAFFIVATTHLVFSGLENLRIGGNDLTFRDRIPDKTFIKGITVNFEYEQIVPEFEVRDIVQKLQLYWRVEDAVDYKGPIEIVP